jgi:outer membrane receptor protein involved in Fe transport
VGAEIRPDASLERAVVATTALDGSFAFDPGTLSGGILEVRAPGFNSRRVRWKPGGEPLEIVLESGRAEEVTVTATRSETRLADATSRVVVLDARALRAGAAITVDEALRGVPGFSLFRRSGSQVANPTAQGASLRGVGPSGASRTLVLLDGVPVNDAFGGWVYWSRLPSSGLERVEVVEGAASDLYGSAALGGVVQGVTRSESPFLALEALGGASGTGLASLYAAGRHGQWGIRLSADAFSTDGYTLVAPDERGPVDTPASSSHLAGTLTVDRRSGDRGGMFLRASLLGESRENGTPLQVNDTDWQQAGGGGDWKAGSGRLSARGWYGTQSYRQTFSAVASDRSTETLTRRQRVPSEDGGFALQWSGPAGSRHAILAGVEARWVEGRTDETAFGSGRPTALVTAGGSERTLAAFAADRVALGTRGLLTLGIRVDRWVEEDGRTTTTPLNGAPATGVLFPDRKEGAVSPRASVLVHAGRSVDVTAAGYGAFRAPTLNELYRSFRVGDTVTQANAALDRERLWGGEAGLRVSASGGRLGLRLVGFLSRVEDPVANVTLSVTPQLTTRKRQNLGRTLSRGIAFDAEARTSDRLLLSLGYALTDSVISSFPPGPDIEGNTLPQVPRHQATLLLRYAGPRGFDLAAQLRWSSRQFEDDRNELPLEGYWTLDARGSRRLWKGVEVFMAIENVTGERYEVGLTPVRTLGPPRLLRAGARLEWNGS